MKTTGTAVILQSPGLPQESVTAMTRLISDLEKTQPYRKGEPGAVATPVTFSDTIGLFTPAQPGRQAGVAVLLASPWGYEDMCTRKFWRVLAESLSDAGIASLRFDYPGTGDALEFRDPDAGLSAWRATLLAAAETLRGLSGMGELVVIGQGIGASLAYETFANERHVRGLALLAPAVSGRGYVREMSIWAQMIEEAPEKKGGTLVFGGVALPEPLIADIKGINLGRAGPSWVKHYLLASRHTPPSETALAEQLRAHGATVELLAYEGYNELVHDLSTSRPPLAMIGRVTDWIGRIGSEDAPLPGIGAMRQDFPGPADMPLRGDGFVEKPVRFGEGERLYGILCEPADGERKGATVILLSTAYERASGWGRITALAARQFAAKGIASLRFDPANVADSPPLAGVPAQIIYSEAQHLDVAAAIDFIEGRGLGPVILTGRCSGGYLAFRTAARDPRVRGLVVVNAYTLFWDPAQSIDEWLQFSPQRLSSYGSKALKLETWKKILRGDVNLGYAALNTFRFLRKRLLEFAGPLAAAVPALSREGREVHGALQAIQAHQAELVLLYRDNDVGLHHFSYHFGADGAKLARYPNARLVLVPDADRNMTKPHARAACRQEIEALALKFPPGTTNQPS